MPRIHLNKIIIKCYSCGKETEPLNVRIQSHDNGTVCGCCCGNTLISFLPEEPYRDRCPAPIDKAIT